MKLCLLGLYSLLITLFYDTRNNDSPKTLLPVTDNKMTKLIVLALLCVLSLKAAFAMPVAENQEPLQVVPLEKSAVASNSGGPVVPEKKQEAAEAPPAEAKSVELEKPSLKSEPAPETLLLSEKAEEKKDEALPAKAEEKKEEPMPEKKTELPLPQPQEAKAAEEKKLEPVPEPKKEEEILKLAASEAHEAVQVAPQEQKQEPAQVLVEQPVSIAKRIGFHCPSKTYCRADLSIVSLMFLFAESCGDRGKEQRAVRLRRKERGGRQGRAERGEEEGRGS